MDYKQNVAENLIGKLTFKMIKFIDFLDRKSTDTKSFYSCQTIGMYRAKIINQYLRKFRTFCNQYPDTQNDIKQYEDEIWEYERRAGIKRN